jgi:hypothetical protein
LVWPRKSSQVRFWILATFLMPASVIWVCAKYNPNADVGAGSGSKIPGFHLRALNADTASDASSFSRLS